MISYIIRKILMLIPMLLVLTFLVYLGLELMPGDPVSYMIGPEAASLAPEQLDAMRQALGLDQPFLVRYWLWLQGVLTGNFGFSLSSGQPISGILAAKLPATLQLSVAALIFSSAAGVVLGVVSALRRGTAVDNSLTVLGMIGLSIPEFFLGLVLVSVFAIRLGWFPAAGRIEPGDTSWVQQLDNLFLPAMALGVAMSAGVMRYSRAAMLDARNKAFVVTARSKGMPEWRVNLIHGFRVALTPVVVLVGFRLPILIGGSVVIEQIFQWPGIGLEFITAVRGQNYPLIMMITLLSVSAVLISSLVVDLVTAWIDPRVRLE
ncbi:ABC transporter permease [Tessaracoccus defluvii]|uniref:ABC transporter permease n=1 Tax=Tessaracoccus defluvii TaxID=1285901 RepID=A0A7H0H3Z3_9ACTN|nr:ABC transporter permease [Tessaracoccus defluvii]QNP55259.1 ABC transporter permease [Tessaracoccus defluvii]